MLFSSFAHKLLLVFGIVFLATLLVVGSASGLFGETAAAVLSEYSGPLRRFYSEEKELVDPVLKWAGFLITLYGAIWTVHKSWHYAEMNLPNRLLELNRRWHETELRRRPHIIPALSEIATIHSEQSTQVRGWQKLLLWIYNADQRRLLRCSQRLDRHEAELRILTANHDRCRAEITTGYLEIGSLLARCAPANRQAVLNVFKKPLEFDNKDLDALELSAKQAFAIGYEQPAFRYLSELSVAAAESSQQIRHFRAQRYQAEILHGRDTQSSWADARAKLAGIIASLNSADGLDPIERTLELALSHELLAGVQITREKFTVARAELDEAKELFRKVPPPHGPQGLRRLDELSKRLDEAEKDEDNPDVPD